MAQAADVTVIIPVYNPDAGDLERAFHSAWGNKCVQRVIIVDDGSDRAVIPHAIHIRHQGVEAARNTALEQIGDGWIINLDQDDVYALGSIDALRAAVSGPDEYAYGDTDYVLQGEVHRPGEWHPGLNVWQFGARYGVLWHSSKGVRYWHPDRWVNYPYNDWDLVLQLEAKGARGVYVPMTTLRHYKRPTGMMGQVTAQQAQTALNVLAYRWGWEKPCTTTPS